MTRHPRLRLTAPTTAAAAALLLAGCGGGDEGTGASGKDDRIAGAETGVSASPSPTPSAVSDRPAIDSPADLAYTFDWPRTGDKEKDAVLSDSEQSIKAVDLAIVHQDALDKAYLYYYEGEAAAGTESFVRSYVDDKVSITGAYRFYAPEVAVDDDGSASLSYCEDQGKAYVKDLKTGKPEVTKVTSNSYVAYHTALKKNARGVWVVQELQAVRGADECQP